MANKRLGQFGEEATAAVNDLVLRDLEAEWIDSWTAAAQVEHERRFLVIKLWRGD